MLQYSHPWWLATAFLVTLTAGLPQRPGSNGGDCPEEPARLHLTDGPYENYFYSDCNTAVQVVVTNPGEETDLATIEPRLLVAWPAGNSGVVGFFRHQKDDDAPLDIKLKENNGDTLSAIFQDEPNSDVPRHGVSGAFTLNEAATMFDPIMGSVRTMRDYIEGPKLLVPEIQNAIEFLETDGGGVLLSRMWLDKKTVSKFSFTPEKEGQGKVTIGDKVVNFEPGTYRFSASFNYPQLKQLKPQRVLKPTAQALIQQKPEDTLALSFLSYENKLLAGAWRFLTYFGRDIMLSYLLNERIYSVGENSAAEASVKAVLERINREDGTAAHEETLGDYATFLNRKEGIDSTEPVYDYKMVDTDFMVPVMLERYLLRSSLTKNEALAFLCQPATENPHNRGLTYRQLAGINMRKIMETTAAFAQPGGQVRKNLIRLREDEVIGEWRDSEWGLGGGRIPYNVNGALVPAGLRAVSALVGAGFFPDFEEWAEMAGEYAEVWEDKAVDFFKVKIDAGEAKKRLEKYAASSGLGVPSNADSVTGDVSFHAVSLEGGNDEDPEDVVAVMNTDDGFRLFFLDPTNDKFTDYIEQAADNILRPFPAGLLTDVGLVVANPAYGPTPFYKDTFSTNAYHGTVVWGWQLAMMAAGLERQLARCSSADTGNGNGVRPRMSKRQNEESQSDGTTVLEEDDKPAENDGAANSQNGNGKTAKGDGLVDTNGKGISRNGNGVSSQNGKGAGTVLDGVRTVAVPNFCRDGNVLPKVKKAYNRLWDVLDANSEILSSEVWSWEYESGKYNVRPLGSFPPPPNVNPTESNVRQLWSLAFLGLKRNQQLR